MGKRLFIGILFLIFLLTLPLAGCYESVQTLILTVDTPQSGATVNTSSLTVSGSVTKTATVKVNDVVVPVKSLRFSTSITLTEGTNVINIVATWKEKETVNKTVTVNYTPAK